MKSRTSFGSLCAWMALGAGFCAAGAAAQTDGWYEFKSSQPAAPGTIGMADWLEKPAGARGAVRIDGDRFVLGDGTPIKFWGVNLQFSDCMPPKDTGKPVAGRFAKYGVNAVRLHKIMEPGWAGFGDPDDSTKFDAVKLDNFDALTAQLKQRGIYYGISWVFGHKVRPADKSRLKAYDEIAAAGKETSRVLIFIAEDVQDLRIEMLTNLLKHKNPHTGQTYAEDPAVNFVEFQNEDSIFFHTFSGFNKLGEAPTYKKLFLKRFSDWLRAKYGSHEGLVKAWGEKALNAYDVKDEHLDKGNIMPNGNPWLMSPPGLVQAAEAGTKQRLLDNARFLYEVQLTFYRKFEKAVRATGYSGPLVGSCWTTPHGLPLYYNLNTDREVGIIDRHNYFGGQKGYSPKPGPFSNASQLGRPGCGLFSSGLLQVADRPFAFSEWSSVFPNQWALESVSMLAAYGMGLQGWDASYQFTSSAREGLWNVVAGNQNFVVDRIDQIGLYPVLARMIHRGDVQQGEAIATRRVSLGEMAEGGPAFLQQESSDSTGDFKEVKTVFPSSALAAGRVTIEFVDKPAPNTIPDMAAYMDGRTIKSGTGQLRWTPNEAGDRGWFAIDTPGTQAAVGFVPSARIELKDITVTPATPFCGVYLTSLDRKAGIAQARTCLLVALARVRNTGMKFNDDMTGLIEVGKSPLRIEPVKAAVRIKGRKIRSVQLLDHDGVATDRTIPAGADGRLDLDGARDRTPYYLVEFE